MKQILFSVLSVLILNVSYSQEIENKAIKIRKFKAIAGVSIPEFFHAGVTYRIANVSLIGVNGGVAPSWGEAVGLISFEHRLYFGPDSKRSHQKTGFFRQGVSILPGADAEDNHGFTLSFGKDIIFDNPNSGVTIDAGFFLVPYKDYTYSYSFDKVNEKKKIHAFPALRVEFYF